MDARSKARGRLATEERDLLCEQSGKADALAGDDVSSASSRRVHTACHDRDPAAPSSAGAQSSTSLVPTSSVMSVQKYGTAGTGLAVEGQMHVVRRSTHRPRRTRRRLRIGGFGPRDLFCNRCCARAVRCRRTACAGACERLLACRTAPPAAVEACAASVPLDSVHGPNAADPGHQPARPARCYGNARCFEALKLAGHLPVVWP